MAAAGSGLPDASQRPLAALRDLPDLLGYLFHQDSLLHLAVLAVMLSLAEWVGSLPGALAAAGHPAGRLLFAVYFFLVARKAALGSRRLPIPSDHVDTWDSLFQPLLEVALATSVIWVPLLFLAASTTGIGDFMLRYQGRPVHFLADQGLPGHGLLALWLVQAPAAVVAALCSRSLLSCADPSLGLRLVSRVGQAYLVVFVLLCALGLGGYAVTIAAGRLATLLPIPLAGPVLAHLLQLWAPLAQARTLGSFVHRHAGALLAPQRRR